MKTDYHPIVYTSVLALFYILIAVFGLNNAASAASDYKVVARDTISLGDWEHHQPWRVIRFYLPADYDSNYDAVLQMSIRSTNNSKYDAIYLSDREFSLDEFDGCDPAHDDRYDHERVDYLPFSSHKQWITYHRTISGHSLQPGDNYLLVCSRNKHGEGAHQLDNFYLKDIVLHYREYKPAPEFCPAVYAPVCGVDGRTYGNACEAESARVEIYHEGECSDL